MGEVVSTINPFDDPGGAFQGGGAVGGAAQFSAERGDPRGQNPDAANFNLNWNPDTELNATRNNVAQLRGTAQGIGQQAYGMGGTAAEMRGGAMGAATRLTPGVDQQRATGELNMASGRGQSMGGVAGDIGQASQVQTGNAAQNVRQQGVNDSLNAALALAGSGGGLGGSAAAMSQAMQQAPAEIARAANDAARIQQESDEANAQRRLQGLGMQGDLIGAARAGDLNAANLARQMGMDVSEQALAGMSLNDQLRLGLGQQALGYDQAGIEGQIAAGQLGLGAGQLGLGADQLGLQGRTADLEGRLAYEQMLTDLYGIDVTGQQAARSNDIQGAQNATNLVGGIGTGIAGLAMLSDERAKTDARLTSLKDRFSALSGRGY